MYKNTYCNHEIQWKRPEKNYATQQTLKSLEQVDQQKIIPWLWHQQKYLVRKQTTKWLPLPRLPSPWLPSPRLPSKYVVWKKTMNQIIHHHTLAPTKICNPKTDYETNNHCSCLRFHANVKKISFESYNVKMFKSFQSYNKK